MVKNDGFSKRVVVIEIPENEICSERPDSQFRAPPLAFVFVIVSYLAREDFRLALQSQLVVTQCNVFVLDDYKRTHPVELE